MVNGQYNSGMMEMQFSDIYSMVYLVILLVYDAVSTVWVYKWWTGRDVEGSILGLL
jgi:hypothetical protein